MRLSINGSPNLFAIAARCKGEVTTAAQQVVQQMNQRVTTAKQKRQEFQATITALQKTSKQLGRSITQLQKALVKVQPTLIHLNRQLNHWQHASEEPLTRINAVLQKSLPHHEEKR